MLKQRVITALILVAFLLPALAAPQVWPFALLSLLLIGAAGWEWARLNDVSGAPAVVLGLVVAGLCGTALWAGWGDSTPGLIWWAAMLIWVLGGAYAIRGGPAAWPQTPRLVRLVVGLALLWTAWLALTAAKTIGVNFILSTFCLVWAADIAAYFGGRAFGRRKLALAISPGKSWEGVWSGMLGALILAAFWLWLDMVFKMDSLSLYGRLYGRLGAIGMVLVVVFLCAMSVVGDLFESLVKRSAGAKDSSALLPGHGGVLDRVDALLPVFPIAMALVTV
jgi:phosphatidate cytidylyltransferase